MRIHDEITLPPIFDDLDVGIIAHHPDTGEVLDVNQSFTDLFGYSAEELRAVDVSVFTAPSTDFTQEEAMRRIRAAADGDPQVFEWKVQRANGELCRVHIHLNSATLDGHQCVLAETLEKSEFHSYKRRVRLLNRIIRHNLRNKMTVLLGHVNQLQQSLDDESLQKEFEPIIDITTDVGSLSDSVRQIEELAEPDAAQRSPTNLTDVALRAVEDARKEYSDVQISVENTADVWVIAGEGITYALDHAIANAIEHNDRTPSKVALSVKENPETGHGEVHIADNGPEIPEQEIAVLKEGAEVCSTYHGTGVGLWVMQWCVDSLGGELKFEENHPCGNVVTIVLPQTDAPTDE
ncbi:ATP-binding protein [Haloarcula marina]|uniref:ATP-binding protein n=1 Tax=Haloarcula marina TaxID=2961574 RepID=UPI0020B74615|nr:PAS domain-containing sensor histidine kinase [Halomicroarcula marina]